MIKHGVLTFGLLLTASCGEAPADDNKAGDDAAVDVAKDQVTAQKKSIEEAAEEATKLIEADAKAEIDAAAADQPTN